MGNRVKTKTQQLNEVMKTGQVKLVMNREKKTQAVILQVEENNQSPVSDRPLLQTRSTRKRKRQSDRWKKKQ